MAVLAANFNLQSHKDLHAKLADLSYLLDRKTLGQQNTQRYIFDNKHNFVRINIFFLSSKFHFRLFFLEVK